ncbi:MAG: pilin [Betaproteobacteria bacterium]|nr:pilin [Betaproteobacteria bacterium]
MSDPRRCPGAQRGLSLVGVLIALSVVGFLAQMAVPGYAGYTRRVYISEGLELAAPAKAAATEYYELEKSGGTRSATRVRRAGTVGEGQVLEVVVDNPSKGVEAVMRQGSLVVVSYMPVVDPEGVNVYYLVLRPSAMAGATAWSCLSGDQAQAAIDERNIFIGGRLPMPAQLAGSACR